MDMQLRKGNQDKYKIGDGMFIRSVVFLHNGNYIAVMCLLEVLIIDLGTGWIIKTIKRLSAPKNVISISHRCMCILFSDNYCMLHDLQNFQIIYTMIGIPNDHKGIKVSEDGLFMLYGNDTAIQVWNVAKCCIEVLSHKFKYLSCYSINRNGSDLYLGTFNGQILQVKLVTIKQLNNSKVPFAKQIKLSSKCLLAVQVIDFNKLVAFDFGFSCYVVNLQTQSSTIMCKLQPVAKLTKPLTFIYSSYSQSVYAHLNEDSWRLRMDGSIAKLANSKDFGLARNEDSKKVMLINFENNSTFTLQQV